MVVALAGVQAQAQNVGSSLLLLIDASGSMGDPVGGGNPQRSRIEAAKSAATAALGRAARTGSVEVAVLAFSGDCANPVPRHQDFTRDVDRLSAFIAGLQPGGGTPMADALLFANRFMGRNGKAERRGPDDHAAGGRPERLRRRGPGDGDPAGERDHLPSRDGGVRDHAHLAGSRRTCARSRRRPAAPITTRPTPRSSRTCSWNS